jgi:hypothetical protein
VLVFIALDAVPIEVSAHTTVPTFISSGQYRRDLSPGEIVVVVSGLGNAGMLWQAETDFYMRVSGGYFTEGISHRTDLPMRVQHLANPSPSRVAVFERFVRYNHVGAILVDASAHPAWAAIFRKMGLVGHTTGGVTVYPTNGCQSCHPVSQAQLGKAKQPAT